MSDETLSSRAELAHADDPELDAPPRGVQRRTVALVEGRSGLAERAVERGPASDVIAPVMDGARAVLDVQHGRAARARAGARAQRLAERAPAGAQRVDQSTDGRRAGRPAASVGKARPLAAAHPLHERLWQGPPGAGATGVAGEGMRYGVVPRRRQSRMADLTTARRRARRPLRRAAGGAEGRSVARGRIRGGVRGLAGPALGDSAAHRKLASADRARSRSVARGHRARRGIEVRSPGWVPTVELRDVTLLDAHGRPALELTRVVASVRRARCSRRWRAWSCAWPSSSSTACTSTSAATPQAPVRRRARPQQRRGAGATYGSASDWILHQGEIACAAALRWTDEQRGARRWN